MSNQTTTPPIWRRKQVVLPVFVVALIALLISGTRFYTPGTEPEPTAQGANANLVQNPTAYAQEQYQAAVVPTIEQNAIDIVTLVTALQQDANAAGAEYGHKNGDSPWSFPVTATGTVAEGEFGEVALEIAGMPAGLTVGVQTGPAITGTAIRDATGLMTFEMFINQIDFATAATALNDQVKAHVLAITNFDELLGKEITVVGAFTYDNTAHIKITAISIEASNG